MFLGHFFFFYNKYELKYKNKVFLNILSFHSYIDGFELQFNKELYLMLKEKYRGVHEVVHKAEMLLHLDEKR